MKTILKILPVLALATGITGTVSADNERLLMFQIRHSFAGPSVTRLELRYLPREITNPLPVDNVPVLTLYSSNPRDFSLFGRNLSDGTDDPEPQKRWGPLQWGVALVALTGFVYYPLKRAYDKGGTAGVAGAIVEGCC